MKMTFYLVYFRLLPLPSLPFFPTPTPVEMSSLSNGIQVTLSLLLLLLVVSFPSISGSETCVQGSSSAELGCGTQRPLKSKGSSWVASQHLDLPFPEPLNSTRYRLEKVQIVFRHGERRYFQPPIPTFFFFFFSLTPPGPRRISQRGRFHISDGGGGMKQGWDDLRRWIFLGLDSFFLDQFHFNSDSFSLGVRLSSPEFS